MNLLDSGLTAQLQGRLRAFKKDVQGATREIVGEAGRALTEATRAELLTHGRGMTVSQPGEPPAAQTLKLYRSIGMQWRATRSLWPRLRVGSGDFRARFLEFGTFKMKPRPFMRRALRKALAAMGRVQVSGSRRLNDSL